MKLMSSAAEMNIPPLIIVHTLILFQCGIQFIKGFLKVVLDSVKLLELSKHEL